MDRREEPGRLHDVKAPVEAAKHLDPHHLSAAADQVGGHVDRVQNLAHPRLYDAVLDRVRRAVAPVQRRALFAHRDERLAEEADAAEHDYRGQRHTHPRRLGQQHRPVCRHLLSRQPRVRRDAHQHVALQIG